MSLLSTILVLLAIYVAVFLEAAFPGARRLLGAQVDLLPAILVYAGLNTGLPTVCLAATLGGLLFDSLSANPLGVSVLPLLLVGVLIYQQRELILRDELFAQTVLGLVASAVVPLLTLILLLTLGRSPLLGWGSLWQWIVMTVGGGLATPVVCAAFSLLDRAFIYRRASETTFRPDREIRRGRN
ncbi:MAG: hypothetical protein U1F98_10755 [Verrucomicrobiota bacterium]